jgi:hypothetical protein
MFHTLFFFYTIKLLLVLPRLGYGWLGSAFDGFQAVTKLGEPSRHQAAGFSSALAEPTA